ncbi:hypothetical protein GFL63_35960 [Rhizobium leguminosarum bv. viciae]|nr:hypothetical protein [Rhizobium leguminosarum bv. viciae]
MPHAVSTDKEDAPDLLAYYRPLGLKALVAATMMQRHVSQPDTLRNRDLAAPRDLKTIKDLSVSG